MEQSLWIPKAYFLICLLLRFQDVYTQGCKNMLFYTETDGHYLQNHAIRTTLADSSSDCAAFCYMSDGCQSINYRAVNMTCDINDSDHFQHPNDLIKSPGFVYVATKNACSKLPCPSNTKCQPNFVTGGYTCLCAQGYRGPRCSDIDECADQTHNCTGERICKNTKGSFRCECTSGYKKVGDYGPNCVDIDECTSVAHACHVNARCSNSPGTYVCQCLSGYEGDGSSCSDIDECTKGAHNCSNDAVCKNTIGSFTCECPSGYKMDGNKCFLLVTKYVITVYTGSKTWAGTDATVWITVTGKQLNKTLTTTEFTLPGKFAKNYIDRFDLQFANMNPITELNVRTRKNGAFPKWYLNKISVDNTHQKVRATFTCNCWISPPESKTMSSPTIENY